MLLVTAVAACVLATTTLIIRVNPWWFVILLWVAILTYFALNLDRMWSGFLSSFIMFTVMLNLFYQRDPTRPLKSSRFAEADVRRMQVAFRYFAAGYLVVFGLGFALFQIHLYSDVPGGFLMEVGVAPTLFNAYMGLLGVVLLVRTWRQQGTSTASTQHLET